MTELVELLKMIMEDVDFKKVVDEIKVVKKEAIFLDLTAHAPVKPKCDFIETLDKEKQLELNRYYHKFKKENDINFKVLYANKIFGYFINWVVEDDRFKTLIEKNVGLDVAFEDRQTALIALPFKRFLTNLGIETKLLYKDKDGDIKVCETLFSEVD